MSDNKEQSVLVVWAESQLAHVLKALYPLALADTIVHITSELYSQIIKRRGRQEARKWIKPITAHNEKMGYDWSVVKAMYNKSEETNQPSFSAYKRVHEVLDNQTQLDRFQLSKSDFESRIQSNEQAPIDRSMVQAAKPMENGALVVRGSRILEDQLSRALQHAEELQSKINEEEKSKTIKSSEIGSQSITA